MVLFIKMVILLSGVGTAVSLAPPEPQVQLSSGAIFQPIATTAYVGSVGLVYDVTLPTPARIAPRSVTTESNCKFDRNHKVKKLQLFLWQQPISCV